MGPTTATQVTEAKSNPSAMHPISEAFKPLSEQDAARLLDSLQARAPKTQRPRSQMRRTLSKVARPWQLLV